MGLRKRKGRLLPFCRWKFRILALPMLLGTLLLLVPRIFCTSTYTLQQRLPEFGFIMSRFVASPTHDELWRECYRCIRELFPDAPVIVIDDHSNLTLVDRQFEMVSSTVVPVEFPPGKREILPFFYFHRLKFRKAVLLSDGMFILKKEPLLAAINNTHDWRFLWHFTRDHGYAPEVQRSLIDSLRPGVRARLRTLQSDHSKWVGCFAAASIVSWDFVDRIEKRYGFFNMIDAIHSRTDRMALERVVAVLAVDATGMPPVIEDVSVYGDIREYPKCFGYRWEDYVRDRASGAVADMSVIKVWNGRR